MKKVMAVVFVVLSMAGCATTQGVRESAADTGSKIADSARHAGEVVADNTTVAWDGSLGGFFAKRQARNDLMLTHVRAKTAEVAAEAKQRAAEGHSGKKDSDGVVRPEDSNPVVYFRNTTPRTIEVSVVYDKFRKHMPPLTFDIEPGQIIWSDDDLPGSKGFFFLNENYTVIYNYLGSASRVSGSMHINVVPGLAETKKDQEEPATREGEAPEGSQTDVSDDEEKTRLYHARFVFRRSSGSYVYHYW